MTRRRALALVLAAFLAGYLIGPPATGDAPAARMERRDTGVAEVTEQLVRLEASWWLLQRENRSLRDREADLVSTVEELRKEPKPAPPLNLAAPESEWLRRWIQDPQRFNAGATSCGDKNADMTSASCTTCHG